MSKKNASVQIRRDGAPHSARAGSRVARIVASLRRRIAEDYFLFPLFALLLVGSAWVGALHLLEHEREATTQTATQLARGLADAYEAQVVRSLEAIDQTLKTVAYAYTMSGHAALSQLQDRAMLPSPIVFRMAMTDARGNIVASTQRGTNANVAAQPYFLHCRSGNADQLYVAHTQRNPRSGAAEIIFSRPLEDASGRFAGIVMLAVDPSYFTSGYDFARIGGNGVLALLGKDGAMRVMQHGDAVDWGQTIAQSALSTRSTASLGVRPWDAGTKRFTEVRVLRGFPLIAVVGLSQSEQFERYQRDRSNQLRALTVVSVLVLMLTAGLSLKSRQLAKSRSRTRRLEQTYLVASEASLDAFFVWDLVSRMPHDGSRALGSPMELSFVLREVNRRGLELIGKSREHALGTSPETLFTGADARRIRDEFAAVYRSDTFEEHEWMQTRENGARLWLHRRVVRVDDGLVAIVRDVTSRKHAEVRRAEQIRVLEMIATSAPLEDVLDSIVRVLQSQISRCAGAIMLRDDDGTHVRLGAAPTLPPAFAALVDGEPIGPDASPATLPVYSCEPVSRSLSEPRIALALAGSAVAFTHCRALPILGHDGRAVGSLALFVSGDAEPIDGKSQAAELAVRLAGIAIERTASEKRIRHMATHDALTGLPNRTLMSDRLEQMMLQAQRYERSVAVVFVDLDNFKLINDSLGHSAGDDLLRETAVRMANSVRSTDTVVRLGGDEFVLVIDCDRNDVRAIETTVKRLREAILEPVELAGQSYHVTCSMGVAMYPADGDAATTLLQNADAAMYRAKELGRNNYQLYAPEMNHNIRERLVHQAQLGEALARGEFRLTYQPQIDAKSGRMFGVEALLRWDHPTDGTILPAQFIPFAEESGLIIPIGDWVLREACLQNRRWQDQGLPPITMSVNVSARQFMQAGWVEAVSSALADTGLAPEYLELELTESLLMQNLDHSIETMEKLERMGVKLAIDDFGTGYSSLSALKHLPVARLKIDQSFVRELPNDANDRAIAAAIIALGQRLKMHVIAEGVETPEQVSFLRETGCHEFQGFHFSTPVSPGEITTWLALGLDQADWVRARSGYRSDASPVAADDWEAATE